MSARDELTKLLKKAGDNGSLFVQFNDKYWGPIADAVIGAGHRKPRVVTTVDELIALPVDAVVRENTGAQYVWEKYGIDTTGTGQDEWYRMGWDCTYNPDKIKLPATVIYEAQS